MLIYYRLLKLTSGTVAELGKIQMLLTSISITFAKLMIIVDMSQG